VSLPNQLSVLRIILAPVFLFLFLSDTPALKQLSLLIFLIAVFTDWYDGWHARKFGMVSKVGIFLDPLADKILTSIAFIGFFILGIMPLWMVMIIVIRDILITLLRSYHEYKGYTMKTSFIAKTKTFLQMTYIFVILILIVLLSFSIDDPVRNSINNFIYSGINYYLMLIVTLITLYTGVNYFFEKSTSTELVSNPVSKQEGKP
jgi:CDP-diacylglycerol---glycerol-3-phosphate 3-phosphatidyltransferase